MFSFYSLTILFLFRHFFFFSMYLYLGFFFIIRCIPTVLHALLVYRTRVTLLLLDTHRGRAPPRVHQKRICGSVCRAMFCRGPIISCGEFRTACNDTHKFRSNNNTGKIRVIRQSEFAYKYM